MIQIYTLVYTSYSASYCCRLQHQLRCSHGQALKSRQQRRNTAKKIRFVYSQKWNCAASFPVSTGPSIFYTKIGGPIVGIYKSLTETWWWKLGTRPRSFICFKFLIQCLCSAWYWWVAIVTRWGREKGCLFKGVSRMNIPPAFCNCTDSFWTLPLNNQGVLCIRLYSGLHRPTTLES